MDIDDMLHNLRDVVLVAMRAQFIARVSAIVMRDDDPQTKGGALGPNDFDKVVRDIANNLIMSLAEMEPSDNPLVLMTQIAALKERVRMHESTPVLCSSCGGYVDIIH